MVIGLPFVIWPSWWALATAGVVGVALPLIWTKVRDGTKSATPFEAVAGLLADRLFLGQSLVLGLLLPLVLRFGGWLAVWGDLLPSDTD